MIARVNRPLVQGRSSSRPRQSPFLIPADFKDLVQKPNYKSIQGDTTKNIHSAGRPEDEPRLQPGQASSTAAVSQSSVAQHAMSEPEARQKLPAKRKLQDMVPEGGKDLVNENDKWRLVKTRNGHLIREPVSVAEDASEAGTSAPSQGIDAELSRAQIVGTQDHSGVPSGCTQRQDTISISGQNNSELGGGNHDDGCEGGVILRRINDQLQWSQDGRQCCKKCKDAITSARHALNRAMVTVRSTYKQSGDCTS